MSVLVGFILMPIGAALGTAVVVAMVLFNDPRTPPGNLGFLLFAGMSFGMIFAAPVTLIALPAADAILRKMRRLTSTGLGATGFVTGIIPIFLFALHESRRTGRFDPLEPGFILLAALGAASGLVVGLAFAYIKRRWKPAEWPQTVHPSGEGARA